MPKVLISADYVLSRTASLMNDSSIDLMRVAVPAPELFPPPMPKHTYKMSHAERLGLEDVRGTFKAMAVWRVDRPEFVIDTDELPY